MVALSPRLGEFVTKAAQVPDLETALWKVLLEYVDLKRKALEEEIARFERKWGMTFEEFSQRCREGDLSEDAYSWEVEQDFWAWESAVTLLQHYNSLREYRVVSPLRVGEGATHLSSSPDYADGRGRAG